MEQFTTGIPDDTPENSVHRILLILQEEAVSSGAILSKTCNTRGMMDTMTVILKRGEYEFKIDLRWLKFELLPCAAFGADFGSGFIGDDWQLELRSKSHLEPLSPPFRWAVFARDADPLQEARLRFLSGQWLRQLVREQLHVARGL